MWSCVKGRAFLGLPHDTLIMNGHGALPRPPTTVTGRMDEKRRGGQERAMAGRGTKHPIQHPLLPSTLFPS